MPLLPYRFRWVGLLLVAGGLYFGYLYFLGGRPRCFEMKIFAVVTAYMETRFFVVSQTNILDELASVLFISGTCLVTLSRERRELPIYRSYRLRAFILAIYSVVVLWVLVYLLVYGWVILWVLSLFFALFLYLYYIIFRYLKWKHRASNDGDPMDG